MTSTAMSSYFKAKLESVIDRGTKMSNQELADLVDEKIGNEDKDPDLKLWKKNPQLGEVSFLHKPVSDPAKCLGQSS